jgi:hypothetical protein
LVSHCLASGRQPNNMPVAMTGCIGEHDDEATRSNSARSRRVSDRQAMRLCRSMRPIARFYGSKTSELAHSVGVLAWLCHQPSSPRAPFNRIFRSFARCRRPDCERGSEAAKLRPFGQSGVRLEVPILVNAQPGFLVGCKATHRLKAARINSLHAIRPQVDHDDFVSRHGESVWHLRCAVHERNGSAGQSL